MASGKSFKHTFVVQLQSVLLGAGLLALVFSYNACSPGFYVTDDFASLSAIDSDMTDLKAKGEALYSNNCAACHNTIENSTKSTTNIGDVYDAINTVSQMSFLSSLSAADIEAIVFALNPNSETPKPEEVEPLLAWTDLKYNSCTPVSFTRDLSLLDPSQMGNIIKDGIGFSPNTSALPVKPKSFYKPNVLSGGKSVEDVGQLNDIFTFASEVGAHVESNANSVAGKFVSCDLSNSSCQENAIQKLVSYLWRRADVSSDADYLAIQSKFASTSSFAKRMGNSVVAAMMMPKFLFILEFQKGLRNTALSQDMLRELSAVELASRLSFYIWDSAPDSELMNVAANNTLKNSDVLKAQVKRMLADPKAQRSIKKFVSEWMGLDGLKEEMKTDSAFNLSLMDKMQNETELFAANLFSTKADFKDFFTSSKTYMDSTLSSHYGVGGVTSANFQSVTRGDSNFHAGILSQGSIATVTSHDSTSPIHRGIFQYERFLCGELGTPPDSALSVEFPGDSKLEQIHGRASLKSCATCHSKFDNLGYVLEQMDPLGRARSTDELGDATGQSIQMSDGSYISTLQELGQKYAANAQTGVCLGENMIKFALQSSHQSDASTSCQFENITKSAYDNGNSLQSYVEALASSALFQTRREEP